MEFNITKKEVSIVTEYIQNQKEGVYNVKITRPRSQKSANQNKFIHGVCIIIFHAYLIDKNYQWHDKLNKITLPLNKDRVKLLFKKSFFSGNDVRNLSFEEAKDGLDLFVSWCANKQIIVPEDDNQPIVFGYRESNNIQTIHDLKEYIKFCI